MKRFQILARTLNIDYANRSFMSTAEILDQLPKLKIDERFKIFFLDQQPSVEEKFLLDQAIVEYAANPQNVSSWEEVESRILAQL